MSFVNRPGDLCLKIVPNGRWKTNALKADGRSANASFGDKIRNVSQGETNDALTKDNPPCCVDVCRGSKGGQN
jgi:hypothetical protein